MPPRPISRSTSYRPMERVTALAMCGSVRPSSIENVKILRARLQTASESLDELSPFYAGFGRTVVEFEPVEGARPFYHFAWRVPRNRFDAAREWLATRAELLPDRETGETTFEFDFWNAQACYALDPGDNIVELIAHREL